MVSPGRIRLVRDLPIRTERDYVLYWMIAARRTRYNAALEAAVREARRLEKPLVVFEALGADDPWASDRFHRFVLDGMAENARALAAKPAAYFPYMEPFPGAGRGLLDSLARRAAVVFTDDYPTCGLPRMVDAAGAALAVRLVAVDSNGLLPMRASDRVFTSAYAFRRFVQSELRSHLAEGPRKDPFRGAALPSPPRLLSDLLRRWPPQAVSRPAEVDLSTWPIDHSVAPVPTPGGSRAGRRCLAGFVATRLGTYDADRNDPDRDATSRLSPYLHFGHLSAHEVLAAVADAEDWTPDRTSRRIDGRRAGWWNLSPSAEGFLDQVVTWRELGFNFCAHRQDAEAYDSLPSWALDSLRRHEMDPRKHVYPLSAFASAATHDPLWNAAQVQLVTEGRIHNTLRMLWGKKILEWSPSPRDALAVMIELNNKYALDGRDPNSTSGIFWILGRYDRPWGPRRPVFGTVRFMSSENTRRKVGVEDYLRRYGGKALPPASA